ncbi:hypothetical protein GOEFS_015_00300 [Gordonia effusa NBRC 100432]|uniref:DUF5926 domain-containing protein n=1 Tax=Gordonia effusa NBRC 100432 TaxID=1077974 RepID=H0QVF6_9ACTN|nr:DUF5926 family protein [Gordonia effusa]GAB16833.1 hypothetical protein GOEFS_015_00300 [Gordonia effusa NBRC 100432]
MAKKSKRGSGPRPGSNRAERVAARKARQLSAVALPPRPFAGFVAECDLVALRAFVASATAELDLTSDPTNRVTLATILPGAVPAIVRAIDAASDADGRTVEGLVAMQTTSELDIADAATNLANSIAWAGEAEVGDEYELSDADGVLTDVLKTDEPLKIIVHDDFSWWFAGESAVPPEIAQMLARANETIMPTARLTPRSGVGAPWWVDAGDRAHLRWVRPENEDELMSALARLHAAGQLTLGEGSRFAGSFRTHGLLVPVFDLDNEKHHEEWYDGVNEFDERLVEALANTAELTGEERRSRDGIRGRQITLR